MEKCSVIKALLFDLDGTLLNTIVDIANSANFALSSLGYPTHVTEKYKYFVGNGVDALVRRILPEEARTPENEAAVKRTYLTHYGVHALDTTTPYDGVVDLLNELALTGKKLAVVSNKPDSTVKSTAAYFFGSDRFDCVVGASLVSPLKPDPAMAIGALACLKVEPLEALFVGDTPIDIQTGKSAGCATVGVTWGFRSREELGASGADYMIDAPLDLLDLLQASAKPRA